MSAAPVLARLQDVADINPPLEVRPTSDETVSFLPMAAVDPAQVDAVDTETRKFNEVSKGYTPFVRDDVLVAKITPCFENGKIVQAKPTRRVGFGSTEFHVVRPHADRLEARYLVHFLRQEHVRKQGERKMTGSAGQRRVPEHFLADLRVPLPRLPQQRRIAEILDKADALRAKRRAALAELAELTRSIFLEMFGDPATNPKGWPTHPLSEALLDIRAGFACGEDVSDGVFQFRMNNVTADGYLDLSKKRRVPRDSRNLEGFLVAVGDVLFNATNSPDLVGKSAFVTQLDEPAVFSNHFFRLRPDPTLLSGRVLAQWLILQFQRGMFKQICRQWVNQAAVSRDALAARSFPRPAISEQRRYARTAEIIDKERSRLTRSVVALDTLFDSLQGRAFRGDL